MLFFTFNDSIPEFSNLFYTILNIFKSYDILFKYYNSSKITQSLVISTNFLFYNLILHLWIFVLYGIALSTIIFMTREATSIEIQEDNELVNRLESLTENLEKLSESKEKNTYNYTSQSTQYIWLNLTRSNEFSKKKIYNSNMRKKIESDDINNKFLVFNRVGQIIAFFKYIFAIKPKMQFKKIGNKFAILIECNNDEIERNMISKEDLNQVYCLFDWLNFAGCEIPIAIFVKTDNPNKNLMSILNDSLTMSMINTYSHIFFINNDEEIENFFNMHHKIIVSTVGHSPKKKTTSNLKYLNRISEEDDNGNNSDNFDNDNQKTHNNSSSSF